MERWRRRRRRRGLLQPQSYGHRPQRPSSSSLPLPASQGPSHRHHQRRPEGEDTCDRQPVTWQLSQKAAGIVARQGAGIYFHPVRFPVSSWRPPELLPGGPKKIHRPCFLSCLSIPELGGGGTHTQFHTHAHIDTHTPKKEQANFPSFCPFLPRDKGVVYCTPLRDSHIHTQSLFDGE